MFLSRDGGSVQTTVPVIRALQMRGYETSIVSLTVSRPLLEQRGIVSEPLDEGGFASAPADCMRTLLKRVRPDVVVSGSSPAKGIPPETPEQHAIIASRSLGVPTVGILDYWGMYKERFTCLGDTVDLSLVPDRLCVLDKRCLDDLTAFGVPAERMSITHNPWMDDVVCRAMEARIDTGRAPVGGLTVLFVSQPFAETAAVRQWSYTQLTLLDRLIECLPTPPDGASHRVIIWPHPAEASDRWSVVGLRSRPGIAIDVSFDRDPRVFTEVDLVVSGHSTVAYEALYYGVPCVSLRPTSLPEEKLLTEELELSHHFDGADSFRTYLATGGVEMSRRNLAARKNVLLSEGLFFSDGHATGRVVSAIEKMVEEGR